jgi:hypothetical protein
MNESAHIEQEELAVVAAKMGAGLFQHVGYRLKELVEIKGYDRHPERIPLRDLPIALFKTGCTARVHRENPCVWMSRGPDRRTRSQAATCFSAA